MEPDNDTLEYSPKELCSRIAVLTKCIMDFWDDGCWGWAHKDVANLLNKSMLRWQTSLARSLILWIDAGSEGELILAWANLGALVEGQLKLFLCVYYNDYRVDDEAIRKKRQLMDPDGCTLERLRQFFNKRIWVCGTNWNSYVELVQNRRNVIHAFKQHDIGTFQEWNETLRLHLSFVRDTGGRLPYPNEYFAGLREK